MSNTTRATEILVIEDDRAFAKILAAMNRSWGLPLTFRHQPEEITAALAAPEHFALIIADCHIPRLEIFELLAGVRATHPDIDIVLMSNLDEEDLRGIGAELEPALVEPKDGIVRAPERFAARVGALLRRHTGERDVSR
jgi:DNA-binding response OmpR family regulator